MSDYFYCKLFDKSVEIKSKKKHLGSHHHQVLTKSIICRYFNTKPNFLHIEDILKKHVNGYNKIFGHYLIICKWKLHFTDTIIHVKSEILYKTHRGWDLRKNLITKIE